MGKVKWVPIDLEVIKSGDETGLYGEDEQPELLALTIREDHLVKKFNQDQSLRPSRAVPISTYDLSNAGRIYNGAKEIVISLCKVLNQKFSFTMNRRDLENLFESDIQNGDVPLFSEKGGVLYYSYQKYAIAIKKKEDK